MADEPHTPLPWYKELWAIRQTLIIILTPLVLLPMMIVIPGRVSLMRIRLRVFNHPYGQVASALPAHFPGRPRGRLGWAQCVWVRLAGQLVQLETQGCR